MFCWFTSTSSLLLLPPPPLPHPSPYPQVLENVTHLNLSHNRLHSLNGISCFMSVTALNLDFNLVASMKDLDRLLQLRSMTLLCIQGIYVHLQHTTSMMLCYIIIVLYNILWYELYIVLFLISLCRCMFCVLQSNCIHISLCCVIHRIFL